MGRNHCFAVSGDNEIVGWGSNRYGQISLNEDFPMIVKPKILSMKVSDPYVLKLSSYFSLLLSKEKISEWGG